MLAASAARADNESPWVDDLSSSLRLIAGGPDDTEGLRAGIEIKLKPGWHTYWRYPGDSGVPPRFTFPGSINVAAVKVLYPAPQAIVDETGTTIGYTDNVVFPLRVTPRQKGKTGDAAPARRLRGVRKNMRAGRGQDRTDAARR